MEIFKTTRCVRFCAVTDRFLIPDFKPNSGPDRIGWQFFKIFLYVSAFIQENILSRFSESEAVGHILSHQKTVGDC